MYLPQSPPQLDCPRTPLTERSRADNISYSQELCAQEPECYFFVFRTDGHVSAHSNLHHNLHGCRVTDCLRSQTAANSDQSLQSLGGADGQCRLKGQHSQSTMAAANDGFPGVCGPKTCNEVVQEHFHWDASTGFLGWQVLGPGLTGYAISNTGDPAAQSHTYRAYDCVGNCEQGAQDQGWGNGKIWGLVPWPWETRDHANELLFVRSPPFTNPTHIEFDLMGGSGSATVRTQAPPHHSWPGRSPGTALGDRSGLH